MWCMKLISWMGLPLLQTDRIPKLFIETGYELMCLKCEENDESIILYYCWTAYTILSKDDPYKNVFDLNCSIKQI